MSDSPRSSIASTWLPDGAVTSVEAIPRADCDGEEVPHIVARVAPGLYAAWPLSTDASTCRAAWIRVAWASWRQAELYGEGA